MPASLPMQFNGSGASIGTRQDLDGDGDLDIGSNNPASSVDFYRASSPQLVGVLPNLPSGDLAPGMTSQAIVGGTEYRIGQLRFLVGAFIYGQTINFRPDPAADGAVWSENADQVTSDGTDGTVYTYSGGTMLSPTTGIFTSGLPIIVGSEPEPSSLGVIGVCGLGLLARHRRKLVKSDI